MTNDPRPMTSTLRMRRLRERRRTGYTRIISIEVRAADAVSLRLHGFLTDGESARTDLQRALRRMLDSIK